METVNDVKKILDDSGKVLVNEHIPQLSEIVTNKVMDVYELGVSTGVKIGEANMLTKVINYFNQFIDIEREKIEQMIKAITE